jgi:hypothetical protein
LTTEIKDEILLDIMTQKGRHGLGHTTRTVVQTETKIRMTINRSPKCQTERRKIMRTSAYLGILAMVLVMASLLMPTLATAVGTTVQVVSVTGCRCVDSSGVLHANLCAQGGQVHWDSFEVLKYNPIIYMYESQAIVTVNEDIADGNCVTKDWGTGLTGFYTVKATYTIGSNPSQTIDLLTSNRCYDCSPCPPIPEVATISLLGLGIFALGGFVYLRTRKAKAKS